MVEDFYRQRRLRLIELAGQIVGDLFAEWEAHEAAQGLPKRSKAEHAKEWVEAVSEWGMPAVDWWKYGPERDELSLGDSEDLMVEDIVCERMKGVACDV